MALKLPALTICQPWAWAIVRGFKRIENRPRPFSYLGPILIHAGKSKAWLDTADRYEVPGLPPESQLEFGKLVGIAELHGCVRVEDCRGEPYAEGPWCLKLRDVRPIEPIPYRGMQGLFYVDEATRAKIVETPRPTDPEGIREWTRRWIECPQCGDLPMLEGSKFTCYRCMDARDIPLGDFTEADIRRAWADAVMSQ